MIQSIGVLPASVERALSYLKKQVGSRGKLVLFGSRARGTTRAGADFDIGMIPSTPIPWRVFCVWKELTADLAWPYRVDLVDLSRASGEFRDAVEPDCKLLHQ